MFLIDDLFVLILGNIGDYANRQYLSDLKDYVKRLMLLYGRGLLEGEEYEKRKTEVLRIIEMYTRLLEQRPSPSRTLDLRL